jgi:hypothetical protein
VRDRVLRQQSTPIWGPRELRLSGKHEAIQGLEAELAQIEHALADLANGP